MVANVDFRALLMLGFIGTMAVCALPSGEGLANQKGIQAKDVAGVVPPHIEIDLEEGPPIGDCTKRLFATGYPTQSDWTLLEQLDRRTDGDKATDAALNAVESECQKKERTLVNGISQFELYQYCLTSVDTKAKLLAVDPKKCFGKDLNKAQYGKLLSTAVLEALDPSRDYSSFVKIRNSLHRSKGLNGKVYFAAYSSDAGTKGDIARREKAENTPEEEERLEFWRTKFGLRLKEAQEVGVGSGRAGEMARLSTDESVERLEALCEKCIRGTLVQLAELGKSTESEKDNAMQEVADDLQKWAHTLSCAMSSKFPDCLPVSVYRMWESNMKAKEFSDLEEDSDIPCSEKSEKNGKRDLIADLLNRDIQVSTDFRSIADNMNGLLEKKPKGEHPMSEGHFQQFKQLMMLPMGRPVSKNNQEDKEYYEILSGYQISEERFNQLSGEIPQDPVENSTVHQTDVEKAIKAHRQFVEDSKKFLGEIAKNFKYAIKEGEVLFTDDQFAQVKIEILKRTQVLDGEG